MGCNKLLSEVWWHEFKKFSATSFLECVAEGKSKCVRYVVVKGQQSHNFELTPALKLLGIPHVF